MASFQSLKSMTARVQEPLCNKLTCRPTASNPNGLKAQSSCPPTYSVYPTSPSRWNQRNGYWLQHQSYHRHDKRQRLQLRPEPHSTRIWIMEQSGEEDSSKIAQNERNDSIQSSSNSCNWSHTKPAGQNGNCMGPATIWGSSPKLRLNLRNHRSRWDGKLSRHHLPPRYDNMDRFTIIRDETFVSPSYPTWDPDPLHNKQLRVSSTPTWNSEGGRVSTPVNRHRWPSPTSRLGHCMSSSEPMQTPQSAPPDQTWSLVFVISINKFILSYFIYIRLSTPAMLYAASCTARSRGLRPHRLRASMVVVFFY